MGSSSSKQQPAARKERPAAKPARVPSKHSLAPNSHLADPPGTPGFASADFVGLIKVTVDQAFMVSKGHYNVTMTLGLQVMSRLHVCAQLYWRP